MDNTVMIAMHTAELSLRARSVETIRNSAREMHMLGAFLHPVPLVAATEVALREWAASISELEQGSRRVKVSRVRSFYRWAFDEELIALNPAARLPAPPSKPGVPHPIREDRLDLAIDGAPRDIRLWLVLAAFAGLRCCEIANLRREDINDQDQPAMLLVRGKGRKQRLVPIAPRLADELRRFDLPDSDPVFSRLDGATGPLTAARVSARGNEYLHSVGVPDTMHSLRHRFGTVIQQRSGDLQTTSTLMGHANVQTTMGYALASNDRALAAVMALG